MRHSYSSTSFLDIMNIDAGQESVRVASHLEYSVLSPFNECKNQLNLSVCMCRLR